MQKIKDLISQLRINDWYYLIPIPLAGYLLPLPPQYNANSIILIITTSILYLAQGYSINNLFDKKISNKPPALTILSLVLLALFSSYLIDEKALILTTLGIITGIIYSAKLKSFLISNLLLNGIGFSILIIIGHYARGNGFDHAWILFIFVFLFSIPNQIIHIKAHRDCTHLLINSTSAFKITLIVTSLAFIAFLLFFLNYTSQINSYNKSFCILASVVFFSFLFGIIVKQNDINFVRRIIRIPSLIYAGVIFASYFF